MKLAAACPPPGGPPAGRDAGEATAASRGRRGKYRGTGPPRSVNESTASGPPLPARRAAQWPRRHDHAATYRVSYPARPSLMNHASSISG
jgi:hypothetical protein